MVQKGDPSQKEKKNLNDYQDEMFNSIFQYSEQSTISKANLGLLETFKIDLNL